MKVFISRWSYDNLVYRFLITEDNETDAQKLALSFFGRGVCPMHLDTKEATLRDAVFFMKDLRNEYSTVTIQCRPPNRTNANWTTEIINNSKERNIVI